MCEFPATQGRSVKGNLTGVADTRPVLKHPEQFLPANVRAVLLEDLRALGSAIGAGVDYTIHFLERLKQIDLGQQADDQAVFDDRQTTDLVV